MRAVEFVTERIDTNWIRAWVQRAVPGTMPDGNHLEWYTAFFKKLKADKEFKAWVKANVQGKLVIKPRLVDDESNKMSVLGAEHITQGDPIEHEIITTINVNPVIDNVKRMTEFVDRLSARFTHELNHAQQISSQLKKTDDVDAVFDRNNSMFKTQPPTPRNEREKYYQYMLNNLEKDAWISEVSQDIIHALGNNSLKYLENIFKQVQTQEYAVAGSKIIQLPGLHTLNAALNYYRGSLRAPKDQLWNNVKKELYGYLSRHINK